ncbi:MAG TPA: MFS transporter [Blastocatellia bacterium]|nr:MFS transporter [Blastocatellia bacterium]HMZ19102.1 MFS transporter [Blastocatellia bacterium]HNG30679.1 MFS transporter [Blastocatellia bacterium]
MKARLSFFLIALVYLGFVSIGLPDGLLGVAWPSMRRRFGLPLDALGSLLVMYTAGYLISSFGSGRMLARVSVGTLLALSCLATGVSLLGYATTGRWGMVMGLGTLAGLGAGAIDAGLNTYAATHFSARMVNWLHAFYGVGALSGPLLMTAVLNAGRSWQVGYAVVGAGQLALAACFGLTQRRWSDNRPQTASATGADRHATLWETLRSPVTWLSVAIFFVYAGIEASAGAWAYSLFTESRGASAMLAGTWVSIYWGALTAGRVLSALLAGAITVRRLILGCIIGQAVGAALLWSNPAPIVGFLGLALVGLASAPIFPSLIAATPEHFHKKHVGNAVGFQIAAAVLGQSLLPASVGFLARQFGLEIVGPTLLLDALLLLLLFEALILSHRNE